MQTDNSDSKKLQKKKESHIFSNANSAIRKNLWEEHNFDERLKEAEDYEWARWAQQKGYYIVYQPEAAVEHTHGEQYTITQFLARILRFRLLRWEIDDRFRTLTRAIHF